MYHSVGDSGPTFCTGESPFLKQLDFLRAHRLPVPLGTGVSDSPLAAAITFDDGYLDNYTFAIPACVERGIPVTVFVAWEPLGSLSFRGGLPMMTREHVREIAAMPGVSIGSHTLSHPKLSRLSPEDQLREVRDSRKVLEDWLGRTVDTFCYPFGDYSEVTVRAVAESGYRLAVTTRVGTYSSSASPYEIPRVAVNRFSESVFPQILTQGYQRYAALAGKC